MYVFLLLGLVLGLLLLWWIFSVRKPPNFPKGKVGIPILGYLPWLLPNPHLSITKLGKSLGNIFYVQLAGEPYVVLNDFETIKKALKMEEFAGRPTHMLALQVFKYSAAYIEGPDFVEHRRFMLRSLKDVGLGKRSQEEMIEQSTDDILQFFRERQGRGEEVKETFAVGALNSIWYLIGGWRVSIDDPRPRRIFNLVSKNIFGKAQTGFLYLLPKVAKMFPEWTGLADMLRTREEIYSLFQPVIDEHEREFRPELPPRDYIDRHLLRTHEAASDPTSAFHGEMGKNTLKDNMVTFFSAGSDTLSSTMAFTILFLLKYPEKLAKLQKEIDNVVGFSRKVSLEDRPKLHYTEAVMQESFRLSSIAPSAVLHKTIADVVDFCGYDIPKNTVIYPNMFAVHRDPEYWEAAGEFRPERFINQRGECVKDERVIPFGIGRRECPAMTIAQNEYFIFLSRLVQTFDMTPDPSTPLPGVDAPTTFVLEPQHYKVIFKERK